MLKPDHISPTDAEDAAIHAAALSDQDNPPLTDADFARMRPAREVLPEIFRADVAARMLKPRGRPAIAARKQSTTIRLDADVMGVFKATGAGWQTRINALLREAVAAGRV